MIVSGEPIVESEMDNAYLRKLSSCATSQSRSSPIICSHTLVRRRGSAISMNALSRLGIAVRRHLGAGKTCGPKVAHSKAENDIMGDFLDTFTMTIPTLSPIHSIYTFAYPSISSSWLRHKKN
jgi:hypothetical protein